MQDSLFEYINIITKEAFGTKKAASDLVSSALVKELALMVSTTKITNNYVLYKRYEFLRLLQASNDYINLIELVQKNAKEVIYSAGQTTKMVVMLDGQKEQVHEFKFAANEFGRGLLLFAIVLQDVKAVIPDRNTIHPDIRKFISVYWNSIKNVRTAWRSIDNSIFNVRSVNMHKVLPWTNNPLDNIY
jgi:hypothetical protein